MLICLALLKYGHNNFNLKILDYCSKGDYLKIEQFYLNSIKPDYNILRVAGSSFGYRHTKKSFLKISNHIVSEETLENMRNRAQTDETKNKIIKSIATKFLYH